MIFKCKKCWPWSTLCLLKQCFLLPFSQCNEYSGLFVIFWRHLIMNWFSFILCTCYSQDWMTRMGDGGGVGSKSRRIHIWLFHRIREMVITLNSYIMNSLSIITQCQPVTFLKSMRRTRLYIRPSTRSNIHTNNNIPIHINTIYQTFELLHVFTYTHWLNGWLVYFDFFVLSWDFQFGGKTCGKIKYTHIIITHHKFWLHFVCGRCWLYNTLAPQPKFKTLIREWTTSQSRVSGSLCHQVQIAGLLAVNVHSFLWGYSIHSLECWIKMCEFTKCIHIDYKTTTTVTYLTLPRSNSNGFVVIGHFYWTIYSEQ